MKAVNFKKAVACLLISGLAVFAGNNAFAAEQQLSAPVTILETLAFESAEPMNFGTVEKPSTGEVTVILTALNNDVESGTANQIVDGTIGTASISGQRGRRVTFGITLGDCTDPINLQLSDANQVQTDSGSFGARGKASDLHGATLTINADVTAGVDASCDYTVSANY